LLASGAAHRAAALQAGADHVVAGRADIDEEVAAIIDGVPSQRRNAPPNRAGIEA
jgi:hypothetical protein